MNDDQITTLAREYAGERYPYLSDKIISLRTQEIKNAKRLIRFLLRRYCLVEKSKVAELEIARRAKENGAVWLTPAEVCAIFPEIAKEVEG